MSKFAQSGPKPPLASGGFAPRPPTLPLVCGIYSIKHGVQLSSKFTN